MSRPAKSAPAPRLRCAIYTRKSSDEGLEQSFNSLHAQREACEAYVLSQTGEGWQALPKAYDDGGFSGGNMDRPGLADLLADVDAGRIDVVVVYKVDRLTRSLADFAKIVERFDARGVSFVSVTQAFNTTSSMGRLTLNVLLSFAQFEREVTGERIRDKIAASKAKGMWMGGLVPLGYDAKDHALVVNPAEADQVRRIFARYLELGSVHALRDELEAGGVVSKRRISKTGRVTGGVAFGRGALFHLLANRHYVGEIVHKDQTYPGNHSAIIDREVFDAVQLKLAEHAGDRRRTRVGLKPRPPCMPLAGRVYDDRGHSMAPVRVSKGKARLYRYYVSSAVQKGRPDDAGSLPRIPAPALEALLRERLTYLGVLAGGDDLHSVVERVEVGRERVVVRLAGEGPLDRIDYAPMIAGDHIHHDEAGMILTIRARLVWRGGAKRAVNPDGGAPIDGRLIDTTLLKALVRAEAWKANLLSGAYATVAELAAAEAVHHQYVRNQIRLAFLAPDIKRAILSGAPPAGLNLQRIMTEDVPLAWVDQRPRWRQ